VCLYRPIESDLKSHTLVSFEVNGKSVACAEGHYIPNTAPQ